MDDLMTHEWEAWREFCRRFTVLTGVNIDDSSCKPMVAALRLWGERLHGLRATQTPAVVAKALRMAAEGRP